MRNVCHTSESAGNLPRETYSYETSRTSKMLCLNLNVFIRLAEVLSQRFFPSCEMFLVNPPITCKLVPPNTTVPNYSQLWHSARNYDSSGN